MVRRSGHLLGVAAERSGGRNVAHFRRWFPMAHEAEGVDGLTGLVQDPVLGWIAASSVINGCSESSARAVIGRAARCGRRPGVRGPPVELGSGALQRIGQRLAGGHPAAGAAVGGGIGGFLIAALADFGGVGDRAEAMAAEVFVDRGDLHHRGAQRVARFGEPPRRRQHRRTFDKMTE